MPFTNAQQARILIGPLSAAAYARTVSSSGTTQTVDVTTLADTAMVYLPGMTTSTFEIAGPLDVDGTANGQYSIISTYLAGSQTNPTPITYSPRGFTTGTAGVVMIEARQTTFNTSQTLTGSVDWALSAQTTGLTDYGVMVEAPTAVTADGNGTARDGGASSANGGVAHLHVTAFSGLTNNIVTIEHSTDGVSSWATLVTFSTYTGITSERVVVAPGTTVRRYLRVVDNVTGTGSTTRAVAFARR